MSYERHSEESLRHFSSRTRQPKVLVGGPSQQKLMNGGLTPLSHMVSYDQGFGNSITQIDDVNFRYIGTTPQLSNVERLSSRRLGQACMEDGFYRQ